MMWSTGSRGKKTTESNAADTDGGSVGSPPLEEIFDSIYQQHFAFVWRSARSLGVQEAWIDDAVQDVFIVVLRRWSDFRPDASLMSWLFGITRRVARDYRRKMARKPTVPLDDTVELSRPAEAAERATTRQTLREIENYLAGLDEEYRALFFLVQIEGLSNAAAAACLSINPNTAASRVRSMKERLNEHLKRAEGTKRT